MRTTRIAGALAGVLLITASLSAAAAASVTSDGGGNGHRIRYGTVTQRCTDAAGGPAGTITYTGPLYLWPPNHKYHSGLVTVTEEDSGDMLGFKAMATHDQYMPNGDELNGSGNTVDDITPAATMKSGTGSASQPYEIRSERSGRDKTGRVYTIEVEARFSDSDMDASSQDNPMAPCEASFEIFVPHDQGQHS